MRPTGPSVLGFAVAVAVIGVVGAGCTQKIASLPRPSLGGCGGLFTTVALPYVTAAEQRALEEAVPHLSASALNLRLRQNYYRIVDEEHGGADRKSVV